MLDEAGALTRAGHHDRAAATIREAPGLWEGPAYVGLDHIPVLRAEAERLTERRLVAFEDLCAAEVAADGCAAARVVRLARREAREAAHGRRGAQERLRYGDPRATGTDPTHRPGVLRRRRPLRDRCARGAR
ncbi:MULTISPECIES: BTAD domain-containing putative transcriptional regulator [unclassified Kribbella]|uniref:BTAD domain-containing putative transcriptional regulator n=1 Tax=unclassified Kribbella TaxID=2644121 RepID=UPI0033DB742D